MKNLIERMANILEGFKKEVEEAVNYVFYGEDGERLFETEREDDFLEVGMVARPDGDFDIGERIVVIREEVITEIREKTEEELNALREEVATLREEATSLREQLEAKNAEITEVNKQLTEAKTLLYEAKKQITSNGKIGNRIETPTKQDTETMTSEERKAAVKERLRNNKK